MMHLALPGRPLAASALALAVAVSARLAGQRLGLPVLRFAAGGAGLAAGWAWLHGLDLRPPNLAIYAAGTLVAAGLFTRPQPGVKRARPAAPPHRAMQTHVLLLVIALAGGWWLAGGGQPPIGRLAVGAIAIVVAGWLARTAESVAAAALSLWAALLAFGASATTAATALVAAAAALAGAPLLPLAAGLGGATATVLDQRVLPSAHPWPLAIACGAPIACLLLIAGFRHRFTRFGRAAVWLRAAAATAIVCLAAFSAAAMAGLR